LALLSPCGPSLSLGVGFALDAFFQLNRPDGGPLRGRDRRFDSLFLQRRSAANSLVIKALAVASDVIVPAELTRRPMVGDCASPVSFVVQSSSRRERQVPPDWMIIFRRNP
jgi:hypothetical protein